MWNKIKELASRSLNLFIQKHWLNCISWEIARYEKYDKKCARQSAVVHAMWKKYNEIYGKENE